MGKASKWLRNLLTGKKEEKDKKKYLGTSFSFSSESLVIPTAFLPETLNDKKRWSFERSSASLHISNHKSSRSLDAIATSQLVSQALLGYETEQNHGAAAFVPRVVTAKSATTVPVPPSAAIQIVVTAPRALGRELRAFEDAAATKIQAFFRSYLARKALKALRGLVKIQALVRGHLVRKQTSDMLRCMNALMSIQVRARIQRIQMTEEPPVIVKRRITHRESAQDKQLSRGYSEPNDVNLIDTRGVFLSKTGHVNQPQAETMEPGFDTNSSRRKQENQVLIYSNSSPLTDTCSSQFDEFSYDTPKRTSQQKYTVPKFNHKTPPLDYQDITSHDSQFGPNYMANTESSKAKARSQSEPKQRPMKQKTRPTPSFRGVNVTPDNQMRYLSSNTKKNQQPWLIKIYRAAKSSKDIECDSTSIGTNSSSYCRTFTAYEPAVNLY